MEPMNQVDTPTSLRPDLSLYGIEEYDNGVCLDTPENRAILRSNKIGWQAVYDTDGNLTDFIEAISPEMSEARSLSTLADKRAILSDPSNLNSDYITGLDLLLAHNVERLVPAWVLGATKRHRDLERKQAANPEKNYKTQFQTPPSRCSVIKSDGVRCMFWTAGRRDEGDYCRTHLLNRISPERVSQSLLSARRRIMQGAPRATEVMFDLADHAISEPVRLKAASEILDRAGIRGGIEIDQKVDVQVRPAREVLAEKLARLVKKPEDVQAAGLPQLTASPEPEPETVDAEIVEDEEP